MVAATTLASAIPSSYGLVTGSCVGLGFLLAWQTTQVSKHRKRAGIKYPQLYATPEQQAANKAALIFNCAQRCHGNTLEMAPFALFATLLTGLMYPRLAAGTMATYVIGKVLYTIGYTTGDPAKRQYGFMGSLASIVMLFSSAYTSYQIYTTGRF